MTGALCCALCHSLLLCPPSRALTRLNTPASPISPASTTHSSLPPPAPAVRNAATAAIGNVWVQAGEERRDRVDVGLCVKNGAKGLYVPDFAKPILEAAPGGAPGGGEAKGGCIGSQGAACLYWKCWRRAAGCLSGAHICRTPPSLHTADTQAGCTVTPSCACWTTTAASLAGCGRLSSSTPRQVSQRGGRSDGASLAQLW